MKTITRLAGIALAGIFSGCGLLTPMSAEQLAAAAKDKNAAIVCGKGTGTGGAANIVVVNADKGVVTNGTITVDGDCKVTFSNAPVAKTP